MNHSQQRHHDHTQAPAQGAKLRTGWWVLAAAALIYLLSEHRAHLLGFLPYALLLLCPLMHVFMHGGHGHGSHGDGGTTGDAAKRESHGTDEEARK